eukprot:m.16863 g.16863  ORF g.16863 m.16863 type:complete len:105 (-) comp8168_c0_seq1:104-418(-)
MCNLSSVVTVVHQQNIKLLNVVNEELLEAIGHHEAGLLVVTEANLDVLLETLEASAEASVNTMWFPPSLLQALVAVIVVAVEGLCPLLDDIGLVNWHHHLAGCR